MSVIQAVGAKDSGMITMFNTGTPYDLMTGKYEMGYDGRWYLNGGLGFFIQGLHGKGNTYKSALLDAFIAGVLKIEQKSEAIDFDTEGSKIKERVLGFHNDALVEMNDDNAEEMLYNRMVCLSGGEWTVDTVHEKLKEIGEVKVRNKKKFMMKTPFMDVMTGEQAECWVPTIVFIDSLTELYSGEEEDMMSKKKLEDSKNKTVWLQDGNKKTLLTRILRRMSQKYGMCVVISCHTGKNGEMGSHLPPEKQLTHMAQKDRIKGAGTKVEMLSHVLSQIKKCAPCQDGAKQAMYPHGITPDNDLNTLHFLIQRNKTNTAGQTFEFIMSQSFGLLTGVTNYHFLRNEGIGLNGSTSSRWQQPTWMPDVNLNRKDMREKIEGNYKLCRCLELLREYVQIQTTWNLSTLPADFSRTPQEVYEIMVASEDIDLDKIFETTGYWAECEEREYMSIMDLMCDVDEAEKKLGESKEKAA